VTPSSMNARWPQYRGAAKTMPDLAGGTSGCERYCASWQPRRPPPGTAINH